MHKIGAAMLVSVLASMSLGGCVAEQSRGKAYDGSTGEIESARHGTAGAEASLLWNSKEISEIREPQHGATRGLQLNEFYQVEIAEDPGRPEALTPVGYVRLLSAEREDLSLYEFYDRAWMRVAYLTEDGSLYTLEGASEEYVGKRQLDGAVREVFSAPSGYGSDSVLQDRSIANMRDPDVSAADPRARGVYHRSHRSAPAIVNYRKYRPGEAALLAEQYERDRYAELQRQRRERAREESGIVNDDQDREYTDRTGYIWKDGNPVDEKGRPIGPHDDAGE